ncbi:hypothetical protein GCM10010299_29940 [Streptomyces tanashiensis]|uniref:Integral membrane protein n=1 Tax=Streptomyces tanashiensis TaxID=67367 RepID=A0ABY6R2H6_9ACTN|nr:hypothetical protein LDH80_27400 [Streptomyces tanashiensis]GGY21854.1 hypothetical protein GCM10010299_29940 [Streptomyces tanashiensis]
MHRLFRWPRRSDHTRSASQTDHAGAVYGSLLAASVIATAGTVGEFPRVQLIVLLLVTGTVFWAAHVYANLAGERLVGRPVGWADVRRAGRHELSIIEAAALPAAALAVSPLLGLDPSGAEWLALSVAGAQQFSWAMFGALNAGAPRTQALIEGLVNLLFVVLIVAAKAALGH